MVCLAGGGIQPSPGMERQMLMAASESPRPRGRSAPCRRLDLSSVCGYYGVDGPLKLSPLGAKGSRVACFRGEAAFWTNLFWKSAYRKMRKH